MIELRADNFEQEVLGPKEPVLICFSSNQSKEEQEQEKQLQVLEQELAKGTLKSLEEVKICRLDVKAAPIVALKYGIMDLPAVVLMHFGLFQGKRTGLQTADVLQEWLLESSKNDLT